MTDQFFTLAEQMHACLCAQVNATIPVDDRPSRCCLLAGSDFELGVSLTEDACRCGTAWVRIASFAPTGAFPNPQETPSNCGPDGWSLTLELGIARCPPIGDATTLPTCEELAAYTAKVMTDAQAIRRAIICCLGPSRPTRRYLMGAWEAFGPEGMCGGGRMTVQLQLLNCDDCPPV